MADKDDDNGGGDSPIPAEQFTPGPEAPDARDSAGGNGGEQTATIAISGQYIKDMSFEAPNTPQIFEALQNEMPNIPIEVDVAANGVGENFYEVVLKIRAEAKVQDQLCYIMEMEYAGLFMVNVPEEALAPVLLVECPLILFPFLRRIVADATSDGGFAPLMLSPIDFAGLYQHRMAQGMVQGTAQAGGEDGGAAEA